MDTLLVQKEAGTLVEQAMDAIRRRIAARQLVPGARLPSIRGYAELLRVSKSTVVDAYERLAAEGVICSRPGSGFYVAGHIAPLSLSDLGPRLDRAVDPLWVSRQSLEAGDDILKPGCGWLPASWLPQDGLRRALRSAARAPDSGLADYASPLGSAALRQILARRLLERGTQASPDQVMLTDSGTQAIDLLCRFLIEPGDAVLVDDPCYFNFHALLRAHRAKVVSVPYTPNGPDIDLFAQALAEHQPRLYITNSGPHNPTGATLSPVVAHRLLKLVDAHDLVVIEDDIFADFELEPAPRLATFDGLNRVVQIGSFSKTLSASVRCGYIAARPDWIEELVDLKIATTFAGSRISQELVLAILRDGSYRKHLEALRLRLAQAMRQATQGLAGIGITPWIAPRAGMFLWCRLPAGLDATEMAKQALQQGMVLAPGNVFSLSQSAAGLMRFNVTQMSDPRTFRMLDAAVGAARRRPA
ncbi:aminotransferase-like domain-containing protein [Pollutimonas bauzanensis]|uniref:DNA-binding transcriptional regulator, MocR family, contains an aminotransferase domain n=1 Tax=Pollutimonas bauzanensis TaxID=658167 RepID=A0A1M5XS34_9BURK|nr:PLP-dependent aminotransferase family protein [Pollutimonas bauzanensis]SHI02645.1 DNA-binding transcriptional regulator, MocR family, contains an aminotransferase domain [Pollutimonas bauzanensis]